MDGRYCTIGGACCDRPASVGNRGCSTKDHVVAQHVKIAWGTMGSGKGRASRDAASLPSLWLPVRVARRRVSSGLCRRAPHPRRQSAWVSSGESLFGTSGANRSTKLAQLRGCDSAMARRGRGRGSGSSTLCFTFPTFVKGGKGGKQ